MTTPTKEQLDELRRLEREATPGPWHRSGNTITHTAHVTRDAWYIPRSDGDLDLIVAARNLLPSLFEDHERLSAENARLRGTLEAAERDMRRPAVRVVPGSFVSGGIRVSISAESPTPGAPYYVQVEHEGHMISLSREGARLMCLAILGAM